MTLYTLDNKAATARGERKTRLPKSCAGYLIASAAVLAAGAVYEMFSHGVISYYMILAFLVPLIGGAVPCFVSEAAYRKRLSAGRANQLVPAGPEVTLRKQMMKELQLAAVVTLTAGCLIKGALEIYGTTNRLTLIYPLAGLVLAAAALSLCMRQRVKHYSGDYAD